MITLKNKIILLILTLLLITSNAYAEKFIIEYDGAAHEYLGSVYKLMINGKYIETPFPPIIFNDYALVPIREVLESMGATVKYIDLSQQIFIEYNDTFIRMKINSPTADINESTVEIPGKVVPKLINLPGHSAKTMVPVRFVSENLGFIVDFDGKNGIIKINSPDEKKPAVISGYKHYKSDDKTVSIEIHSETEIYSYTEPVLTANNVLYIDIPNAQFTLNGNNEINLGAVKMLRFGQHGDVTRAALDLTSYKSHKSVLSEDKKKITISVTAGDFIPTPSPSPSDKPTPEVTPTPDETKEPTQTQKPEESQPPAESETPKPSAPPSESEQSKDDSFDRPKINTEIEDSEEVKQKKALKTVILDAGHGGKDPGAHGILNNKTYNEKDINLDITLRVKKILDKNGINVILTREADTYPTLTERADLANNEYAAMFVSIHSNSATTATANGFEVYYSELNNTSATGISSKEFADIVVDNIDENIDTRNRGTKTADHVVTRSCTMPAILIEVGFLSNTSELELMLTDEFRDSFAKGIANGIIKAHSKIK